MEGKWTSWSVVHPPPKLQPTAYYAFSLLARQNNRLYNNMFIKMVNQVPERTNINPTKQIYNMYTYGGSSLVLEGPSRA